MNVGLRHFWWTAVIAAILLVLAVSFVRSARQQSTIRRIESLGGRVVTTHGEPAWLRWVLGGRSLRIFEQATVVPRLPKTRSGKILRATMRAIADGREYTVPSTIDDPAILDEIGVAITGLRS